MNFGVKRIIKENDIDVLFDFYKNNTIKTLENERFQKWVNSQQRHFSDKAEIEESQKYRKEGFIVQAVFKSSAGQDKPHAPKTIAALILKLAEYKTPEIKGLVLDSSLTNVADIDKSITILMQDVDELCKKEGYDTYLVFTNMMNDTAQTLFRSKLFTMDRIFGEPLHQKQEFVFRRNINPCYMGDPFNWLEKVIWYIKYFVGKEFEDLKYRSGCKLASYTSPIVKHCSIYPKTQNFTSETHEIKTSFVIYENAPSNMNQIFLSMQEIENSGLVFLFSRTPVDNIKNVMCISEDIINDVIKATWRK